MLRLTNLNVPLDHTEDSLRSLVLKKTGLDSASLRSFEITKRSVDARDKGDVHFVMSLDLTVKDEASALRRCKSLSRVESKAVPALPSAFFDRRPVVVGAGPAGLFAALTLARAGAAPILIERGRPVEERSKDVALMTAEGKLDPESNVQFGEGGAGAFSDGKLTCGIKSPYLREVLETFVRHGAPSEILILQKPHIGTDKLKGVVASIRREILSLGGDVLFNTRLESLILRHGHVDGVRILRNGETVDLPTDTVLLAIGHSARDTVKNLFEQGVHMIPKPFAVGVRIEHPQSVINRSQYGSFARHPALGAADYKLNIHTPDGRGVYTFCMCPGGEIIAAASEPGRLAVNGMSYHARAGVNANSALLVGVNPEDFGDDHPLAGFAFQRRIEEAAFRVGGGAFRAPAQRVEDFLNRRETKAFGDVVPSYKPGVIPADLHAVLPSFVAEDLRLGILGMDRQLKGFAMPDAVMTAPETRSSSPVRMSRDETGQGIGLQGFYPVGEGAGYAGGIVSAAVDGIVSARAALTNNKTPAIV